MDYNQEATKKYYEVQGQIEQEINLLKFELARHSNKAKNINWVHVGDLQHILAQLRELTEEDE